MQYLHYALLPIFMSLYCNLYTTARTKNISGDELLDNYSQAIIAKGLCNSHSITLLKIGKHTTDNVLMLPINLMRRDALEFDSHNYLALVTGLTAYLMYAHLTRSQSS